MSCQPLSVFHYLRVSPLTLLPPFIFIAIGTLNLIGHFVKGVEWAAPTPASPPARDSWLTLWTTYVCYDSAPRTCVLSGLSAETLRQSSPCQGTEDQLGVTAVFAVLCTVAAFMLAIAAMGLFVVQNQMGWNKVGLIGMIASAVLFVLEFLTFMLYITILSRDCFTADGGKPKVKAAPFMFLGGWLLALVGVAVYYLLRGEGNIRAPEEFDAVVAGAPAEAAPRDIAAALGKRHDVVPVGNDWEETRTPEVFWSKSYGLFWESASTHFYDPRVGYWYHTQGHHWYAL